MRVNRVFGLGVSCQQCCRADQQCCRAGECQVRSGFRAVLAIAVPVVASVALSATGTAAGTASAAVRTDAGSIATLTSVSCAPGGTCAAGGNLFDAATSTNAFVLTELNGQWGTAIEVPGLAALNPKM